MGFNVIRNYVVVEVKTEKGDYNRIYDKIKNELYWKSDFKTYLFDNDEKNWKLFTERKGLVISDGTCWIEEEYKLYLRKQKLNNLII